MARAARDANHPATPTPESGDGEHSAHAANRTHAVVEPDALAMLNTFSVLKLKLRPNGVA